MDKPRTESDWMVACLWMRILREGSKPALIEAIEAYEVAEARIQGVFLKEIK